MKFSVSQWVSYTLCAIVLVISCVMMAYWVYIGLKIDKKRYDIMIWFLDIPIPYVSHLGTHCDKYLKEFMPSKELAQKEINFDETD